MVVDRVGEVNYRVRQPGRRKPTQLYHVNLLKQWRTSTSPQVRTPLVLPARRGIPEVPVGDDRSPAQKQDLDEVVLQHQDVFSEIPGRTTVSQHDIVHGAPATFQRMMDQLLRPHLQANFPICGASPEAMIPTAAPTVHDVV